MMLARGWQRLLDLAFPARCQGCGELGEHSLCPACWAEIPLLTGPCCAHCGAWLDPLKPHMVICCDCRQRGRDPLAWARSAAPHAGRVRRLIHRLKYHRQRRVAAALGLVFTRWLAHDAQAALLLASIGPAALVPVPLHRRREFWRGFNQAQLLAQALSPILQAPVREALVRIRHTRPQVGLPPAERARNVRGAFAALPGAVERRGVYLLVDDVYTSGATLRECALMLRRAGAGTVVALTAARPAAPELVALAGRRVAAAEAS